MTAKPSVFPSVGRLLVYGVLALGWRGDDVQRKRLERALAIMAIAIIPVAIPIHTVTAWPFGFKVAPGRHSTNMGPDFVVGAIYSGTAAVITIMALFRFVFRLGLGEHGGRAGKGDQRGTAGLIGETSVPASTARNAALAGTAAILRDYARQVSETIARDDFHVRVTAGQPFTLYVTQPLAVTANHEN